MNPEHWWTFVVATFFICGTPGLNMLQVMNSSVRYGLYRTFFTMAGCFLSVLILITSSVAGVGALLKASPLLFDVLRYVGAFYLIYLGVQAWRTPVTAGIDSNAPDIASVPPSAIFRKGFFVGISNPKALLFAAAFFPQFIDPQAAELPQLLLLLATFSVIEISWYAIYAFGGNHLGDFVRQVNIRRKFQRMTGGLFTLFGVLLIAKSS